MSQPGTAVEASIVEPRPADTEGEYELTIDEDVNVCVTVVLAIAKIQGIDPVELPPLHDVQDPDKIAQMVSMLISSDDITAGTLTFAYYEHEVTVDPSGNVTIRED
jgi:hypothetical protein